MITSSRPTGEMIMITTSRSRGSRLAIAGVSGLTLALLSACGSTTGSTANNIAASIAASPSQAPPVSSAQPSSSPSTSDVTHHRVRIVFKVRGSAPEGVDITYGSDSNNITPPGNLGVLGNGSPLPFTGSIKYHSSALYWDINAQLQGGGNITCGIYLKVTDYFTNGTHTSRSKRIAHAHASGGYNICDAQNNND